MKKRFCSVLFTVVALILATTTAFAGSPRTSDSRESWWPSHTPKTSESEADTRWWRPNFHEMRGADTLGPWPESSGLTGEGWRESIFSDYRLVLNGKAAESEMADGTWKFPVPVTGQHGVH